MRAGFADEFLDFLGVSASATRVDVTSVGRGVVDEGVCAEFAKDAWGGLVSGAVGAIDGDAHSFEGEAFWEAGFGVFDVAAEGIVDALCLTDFACGWSDGIDFTGEDELFDSLFDGVIEFVTVVAEKLYPVVFVGVMGGAQDDSGIGAE